MAIWNVGSVADYVGGFIGWSNLPSNFSGTVLNVTIEQNINVINNNTNDNISSSNIAEKYQPILIDLTKADVLLAIESAEGGINSASLGDLSISQGGGGLAEIAKQMREDAMVKLKDLGRFVRFKRVLS